MNRKQGLEILNQNMQNQNLIKHCLAVEAVMRALAQYFNQDQKKWGLAGLLHDLDYEKTKNDPNQHSLIGAKMLEELGLDQEICQAVKAHNEIHQIPLTTLMDKSLFVADPITGLIVASALVLPLKKLADLRTENILNRFKEKKFAKGANREIIKQSEQLLELSLEDFVKISLTAMQDIADDLGL